MDLKVGTSCFLTQRSQGARVVKERRLYVDALNLVTEFDYASKGTELSMSMAAGRRKCCIMHYGNCHNEVVGINRLNTFLEASWNKLVKSTKPSFKDEGGVGFMKISVLRVDSNSTFDCIKVEIT